MAKSRYQRYSKGGRFRRLDASDLGSRSYKEQQQTIINALKLQQAQNKDIGREVVTGYRSAAEVEARNASIIENFENQAFETRRSAIQKRQKTEVENLQGQAKEFEKKAEFWKDFSQTYSQQWGKLAKEAGEFSERVGADKVLQEFYQENEEGVSAYQIATKPSVDLLYEPLEDELVKESHGVVNNLVNFLNNKERVDEIKRGNTVVKIFNGSNKYAARQIVAQIIKDKTLDDKIKNTVLSAEGQQKGLKWNAATIRGHYDQYARNTLIRLDINPNSRAGLQLIAHFAQKGNAVAQNAEYHQKTIEDKHNVFTAVKNFTAAEGEIEDLSDPKSDKSKTFAILSTAIASQTVYNPKDGTFTHGVINGAGGDQYLNVTYAVAEALVGEYTDSEKFVKTILNSPIPGDPKGTTWIQRFPNTKEGERNDKIKAIEEDLLRIWSIKSNAEIDNKNKLDKAKNGQGGLKAEQLIENGDLYTEEGRKRLEKLAIQMTGVGDGSAATFINQALSFNLDSMNQVMLDANLVKDWKDGNIKGFSEVYQLLPETKKKELLPLYEDLLALNRITNNNQLNDIASNIAGTVEGTGASKDVLGRQIRLVNGSAGVQTAIKNDILAEFNALKNEPNDSTRLEKAVNNVRAKVEKGEGVYANERDGNNVVSWTAFVPETKLKSTIEDVDIKEAFDTVDSSDTGIEMEQLIEDNHNPEKGKYIVSKDDLDLAYKLINGNRNSLPQNDIVDKLYRSQNAGSKKVWTKQEIWSKLLGIDLPPGIESKTEWEIGTAGMQVIGFNNYSTQDQSGISLAAMYLREEGELPLSKDVKDLTLNLPEWDNVTTPFDGKYFDNTSKYSNITDIITRSVLVPEWVKKKKVTK